MRSRFALSAPRIDPAVRQARRVVGLYGDPDVTWSILLELELAGPLDRGLLEQRLGSVVRQHPNLGLLPRVAVASGTAAVRDDFANTPYGDRDPLVRIGLTEDGLGLVTAAHHGAIDGLGMVGLTGALLGVPMGTNARGIPRKGGEPPFWRGALGRAGEIVFSPPERFEGAAGQDEGDVLVCRDLPPIRRGTTALSWSALCTLRQWNGASAHRLRQPVIALGVSRRPGAAPLVPDRDTAYSRARVGSVRDFDSLARVLAATEPEPDFPVTDGRGLGPVLTRVFRSRLGASLLVSNLGLMTGTDLRAVRFWPAASGPAGVSFGMSSTEESTTLTVRARRRWFDRTEAERMVKMAAAVLVDDQRAQYGSKGLS